MLWQILHPLTPDRHHQPAFLHALILSTWTSVIFFIPVAILFFLLITALKSLDREKLYFMILAASIIIPFGVWFEAKHFFKTNANALTIASIASFSSLVSVAFYYVFFLREEQKSA